MADIVDCVLSGAGLGRQGVGLCDGERRMVEFLVAGIALLGLHC